MAPPRPASSHTRRRSSEGILRRPSSAAAQACFASPFAAEASASSERPSLPSVPQRPGSAAMSDFRKLPRLLRPGVAVAPSGLSTTTSRSQSASDGRGDGDVVTPANIALAAQEERVPLGGSARTSMTTPAGIATPALVERLHEMLAAERQAHGEALAEASAQAAAKRDLNVEATVWREELASREASWRCDLAELRDQARIELQEEAFGARRLAEELRSELSEQRQQAEAESTEQRRRIAFHEAQTRQATRSNAEADTDARDLIARLKAAAEEGERHRREAADLRLIVSALEERCRRRDVTVARLRSELSSAPAVPANASGSGIPRPRTVDPWAKPGGEGGAVKALARGFRASVKASAGSAMLEAVSEEGDDHDGSQQVPGVCGGMNVGTSASFEVAHDAANGCGRAPSQVEVVTPPSEVVSRATHPPPPPPARASPNVGACAMATPEGSPAWIQARWAPTRGLTHSTSAQSMLSVQSDAASSLPDVYQVVRGLGSRQPAPESTPSRLGHSASAFSVFSGFSDAASSLPDAFQAARALESSLLREAMADTSCGNDELRNALAAAGASRASEFCGSGVAEPRKAS
eukprot:TRINITY_DN38492_c0_g1_i1.p1 TRINITY_DN38492_c0_g1~~TRINITY_DN38492_c0_g1_i1.p1  ORF type:complete len:605 (+),score=113.16 TRINITY_DN38492_c0_g1_i1:65-1816(+)